MRQGEMVATLPTRKATREHLAELMVGRKVRLELDKTKAKPGDVRLSVRNLTVIDSTGVTRVDNVGFDLRAGEIVGIAGLMGAGRTELAMSVFGRTYGKYVSGKVFKGDREISTRTVSDAIRNGVAYATEDRKHLGLNLMDSIAQSITLPSLRKISRRGVVNQHEEAGVGERFRASMRIKASSVSAVTGKLSGGNQQKVVLSKWLFTDPDVLILDEPTRGIDVGAKYEIYTIINRLVAAGKAVVVISSELPELLGICDRIYTLSAGRITGQLPVHEANQESLMELMTKERESVG
jgi:putative multiple sugar transport system ATP-binding protein